MPQIHISESNLTIENKTFSAGYYAKEDMPDGTKRGTFRNYSRNEMKFTEILASQE